MKEPDDAYEYLYGVPHASSVPNRCLKFLESNFFNSTLSMLLSLLNYVMSFRVLSSI